MLVFCEPLCFQFGCFWWTNKQVVSVYLLIVSEKVGDAKVGRTSSIAVRTLVAS